LINGKLSADEALVRGVMLVSGAQRQREALIAALRQAYPAKASTVALR
jgi:hypothetical protein